MSVLKPLEGKPLTFWHVGGDIIWRGDGRCVAIEREQADALRGLYTDETRAAWRAKDFNASRHAATLWTQLTHAMDAQDRWSRLFNPEVRKAA